MLRLQSESGPVPIHVAAFADDRPVEKVARVELQSWLSSRDVESAARARLEYVDGVDQAGSGPIQHQVVVVPTPVAEDMARVVSLDTRARVPYGTFNGCLKTENFTPLEPDLREEKYYCPEVGLVLEVSLGGGKERNELVSITSP
jgi:hypothetical protein